MKIKNFGNWEWYHSQFHKKNMLDIEISRMFYLTIRGGSLKKIAKKIIPSVPTNKKVYTNASIKI
jgi:hypothetical protein